MNATRHCFSSRAVITSGALILCGLGFGPAPRGASAQETDRSQIIEKIHRPSFDFEQCTSLCQIELDTTYFACDKDKEADKAFDLDGCWKRIMNKFQACTASCPADTAP